MRSCLDLCAFSAAGCKSHSLPRLYQVEMMHVLTHIPLSALQRFMQGSFNGSPLLPVHITTHWHVWHPC